MGPQFVQMVPVPIMPPEILPQEPALPPPMPTQSLTRIMSPTSGCYRIIWNCDGKRLTSNDKQAVSPPFEFSFGVQYPCVPFKMVIYPKTMSAGKGGFRKAKGRGTVQVKCEADLTDAWATVTFRICVGSGAHRLEPRGPVVHDFSRFACCGLPTGEDEWDFSSVLTPDAQTFAVCLEILPNEAD